LADSKVKGSRVLALDVSEWFERNSNKGGSLFFERLALALLVGLVGGIGIVIGFDMTESSLRSAGCEIEGVEA